MRSMKMHDKEEGEKSREIVATEVEVALGMAPARGTSQLPIPNLILLFVPTFHGGDIFCPIPISRFAATTWEIPFYIKKYQKL